MSKFKTVDLDIFLRNPDSMTDKEYADQFEKMVIQWMELLNKGADIIVKGREDKDNDKI